MKRVITVRGKDAKPDEIAPYEEALRAAGIEALVLSAAEAEEVDGFDGLLLMGGSDVNPARYGEPADPMTQAPDDARDEAESRLITQAFERDVPVLAICRGLQILNVAAGGGLIQHLEDERGHRVRSGDRSRPAHETEIAPDTKLASVLGEPLTVDVNSRHHQAAGRIGEGLVVSARAKDGIVEGLERPDRRFVLAVQWHPENQAVNDERQARLFRAFAQAVEQSR
ncbi:MAG TPA: gamma-glutamyl-gamma-aminobutyrate hydrolase family protein [Bryobacteraceae bacterium]|nr:gamma-glutamyl-gamma-aminobutyrate hydrolase family protein [Bryobacteraceae bacterium]